MKINFKDRLKKQSKYIVIILSMIFIFACGETIPKYGEVLFVDNENNVISYKKVKINGLTNLSEFEAKNFKYLSNAKISEYVEYKGSIYTATVDEINKVMYQDKGNSINLRYRVENDTIIPYSLNDSIILTLHHNLQGALDFFKAQGLNIESGINGPSFGKIRIFFDLTLEAENEFGLKDEMEDNAMYYPPLNSLAFLPQNKFKHLALVSNPMVITHEFAHSIFAYASIGVLQGDENFLSLFPQDCFQIENEFYTNAMNEGFSDYWAARKTGSADLFYLSITKDEMQVDVSSNQDRSLENQKTLLTNMLLSISNSDTADTCNQKASSISYYWAGTIWASALWEAEKTSGIENFDKYLLKSYTCLHEEFNKNNNAITMATPGNCLVKTLKEETDVTSTNIDSVCTILKRRFSIIKGELDECN